MRVGEIRQFCKLQNEGESLMRAAMSQLNLSARAYHRILKLARTIADLAGSEEIQSAHLAEALQYRPKIIIGRDRNTLCWQETLLNKCLFCLICEFVSFKGFYIDKKQQICYYNFVEFNKIQQNSTKDVF